MNTNIIFIVGHSIIGMLIASIVFHLFNKTIQGLILTLHSMPY